MEDGAMRAIRIVLGVVGFIFLLAVCGSFIGPCQRTTSVPPPSAASAPVKEAEKPADDKSSPPKAPSTPPPRTFEASHKAVEGVAEAGVVGRDASARVHVAVGKPAEIAEEGHEAEEAAKFEEIKKTLTLDELTEKSAQLKAAQEEQAQVAERIEKVRGHIRHDEEFRDSFKSMLINNPGENPTARMHWRQLAKEKEDELRKDMMELQSLEKNLKEVTMRISHLTEEMERGVGSAHKFIPKG
ncbi:MAG: hypothetical protein NT026_00410 [Candidatus Staskawiczbacteria bacterium]|nr:hypothetical protein [Candidatus Staskawiczbacteria bacterium]